MKPAIPIAYLAEAKDLRDIAADLDAADELPRGFRRTARYLSFDQQAMASVFVEGLGLDLNSLSRLVLDGGRSGVRLEVLERDR